MGSSSPIKFPENLLKKNRGIHISVVYTTICNTLPQNARRFADQCTVELERELSSCPSQKVKETHSRIIRERGYYHLAMKALLVVVITTLQRSSRFKNLFYQLELTANKQRIATEALVSIASGVGVECLVVETRADKAFLLDTDEITFSDEDIEVGYLDHKRPFYLAASINQILIKRGLVDTSISVNLISLSML